MEAKNKAIYRCEKCGQSFTYLCNFTRHKLHNKICGTSQDGFKCDNCHKVFSLNATLKHHYDRCIAEDPYRFSCPHCTRQFTFKSSLNKHLRKRCRRNPYDRKKQVAEDAFKCINCSLEFVSHEDWKSHLPTCSKYIFEDGTCSYVCSNCSELFPTKLDLRHHVASQCTNPGIIIPNDIEILLDIKKVDESDDEILSTPSFETSKNEDDVEDDIEDDGEVLSTFEEYKSEIETITSIEPSDDVETAYTITFVN